MVFLLDTGDFDLSFFSKDFKFKTNKCTNDYWTPESLFNKLYILPLGARTRDSRVHTRTLHVQRPYMWCMRTPVIKCVFVFNSTYRIKTRCLINFFRPAMYIGGTSIKFTYLFTYLLLYLLILAFEYVQSSTILGLKRILRKQNLSYRIFQFGPLHVRHVWIAYIHTNFEKSFCLWNVCAMATDHMLFILK